LRVLVVSVVAVTGRGVWHDLPALT
jgi:hypothetical protein